MMAVPMAMTIEYMTIFADGLLEGREDGSDDGGVDGQDN
jgi:hypothetical protein